MSSTTAITSLCIFCISGAGGSKVSIPSGKKNTKTLSLERTEVSEDQHQFNFIFRDLISSEVKELYPNQARNPRPCGRRRRLGPSLQLSTINSLNFEKSQLMKRKNVLCCPQNYALVCNAFVGYSRTTLAHPLHKNICSVNTRSFRATCWFLHHLIYHPFVGNDGKYHICFTFFRDRYRRL